MPCPKGKRAEACRFTSFFAAAIAALTPDSYRAACERRERRDHRAIRGGDCPGDQQRGLGEGRGLQLHPDAA
jgi:hypothetical protein